MVENVIITKNRRLSRIGPDSSSDQPALSSFGAPRRPDRLRRRLEQCGRLQQNGDRDDRPITEAARNAPCQPSTRCRISMRGRRHRGAEEAREDVQRKCLAGALVRDELREDRVIGRMIDAVRNAEQREHRDQQPERRDKPDDREAHRAEHEARDQHRARTDPVDQEARRRLAQRGRDVEGGQREAEFGVADAVELADERKQRRQHQNVEMADEMRRADERNDARVVRARCAARGFGDLCHACS